MTPPAEGQRGDADPPGGRAAADRASADLTGRDRVAWNVLASWGGYAFQVVAGFVIPRLIDQQLGQVDLGIWDFAWSVVTYLRLAQLGVGSSVNRFVAIHRATRDVAGLRRMVASVVGLNLAAGLLVLLLTGVAAAFMSLLLGGSISGEQESTARWVVWLLGGGLALSFACDVFPGVITGCHRWDVHHVTTALGQVITLGGMLFALYLETGLVGLATAHLFGIVSNEIMRAIAAYRVCPELSIRPFDARLEVARELFVFGAKYSAGGLAYLFATQTTKMMLVGHLGPPALALFARPMALVRIVDTLPSKVGLVLTPTAGSLHETGRTDELRQLVLTSMRFCTALVLPISLILVILGGQILRLWMGPRYEQGTVLAVMVAGAFLAMTMRPVSGILMGLNLHGWLAVASWSAAVVGIALSFINVIVLDLGIFGAAVAVAVPALGRGLFVHVYASRKLHISLRELIVEAYATPFLCCLPLVIALFASRILLAGSPLYALLCSSTIGGAAVAILYWRYLLTDHRRRRLVKEFQRARRRAGLGYSDGAGPGVSQA